MRRGCHQNKAAKTLCEQYRDAYLFLDARLPWPFFVGGLSRAYSLYTHTQKSRDCQYITWSLSWTQQTNRDVLPENLPFQTLLLHDILVRFVAIPVGISDLTDPCTDMIAYV